MSDQKQKIAELLKTQRENLGLSIEDIYRHTRINPEFIKVLEAGEFDLLPSAYARLFLKTYARELHLDVPNILSLFDRSVALPRERVTAPSSPERGIDRSKIFLFFLVFALIALVVLMLTSREEPPRTAPLDTTTSPLPTPESVVPSEQIRISEAEPQEMPHNTESVMPSPSETPVTDQAAITRADTARAMEARVAQPIALTTYHLPVPGIMAEAEILTLSAVATETAHLSVSADGQGVFAGAFPMGRQQIWRASDRFEVQIQRGRAVSLSLQNQPLEFASPPDRGLRLTISRTQIRVEELDESAPHTGP